jgi:chromosome segregation ATPase
MAMRRGDRRDSNDDNADRNPQQRQLEPISAHESRQLLMTLRAQKNELQRKVQETEQKVEETHSLYLEEQQRYQTTLTLYQEVQTQAQSYLALYDQEKAKTSELSVQFQTAQAERDQYITLYNEAQSQLKFERRSKAGIKGWETRRKRENEQLKQEIGEMTVLLRDSITRRDAAIGNLEELANRMDRIQTLVDSVGESSTDTPVNLLQKFKRIWQAIQDILAE